MNMKKQTIKLNESQLKKIIKESVNVVLTEKTSYINNRTLNQKYDEQDDLYSSFDEFRRTSNMLFEIFVEHLDDVYKDKAIELYNRTSQQLSKICEKQYNKIAMNYGQQPNHRYDIEHLSKAQRFNHGYTNTEPVWHGNESDD